jgi:hypothetical protein
MKTNSKRYSANWTAFLGVLIAGCFLAAAARATTLYEGKFELTREVHWGNSVLAPGHYSLTYDFAGTGDCIIVRDAQDRIVARTFAKIDSGNDNGKSKLLIAVKGTQRAVSSVQLAGIGEVYQLAHPFAGIETSQEVRNAEAVRVEVSQK